MSFGFTTCRSVQASSGTSKPRARVGLHLVAGSQPTWRIRMLFDGGCPLCMKEVNFLRKRDAGSDHIDFVDIASAGYSPERNAGLSYDTAMGEIHALLPDGSVVTKARCSQIILCMLACTYSVPSTARVPSANKTRRCICELSHQSVGRLCRSRCSGGCMKRWGWAGCIASQKCRLSKRQPTRCTTCGPSTACR